MENEVKESAEIEAENQAKMPENGFSPDADFPVIYAEKGIMPLKFSFKKSKKLVSILFISF